MVTVLPALLFGENVVVAVMLLATNAPAAFWITVWIEDWVAGDELAELWATAYRPPTCTAERRDCCAAT